jgi:hypothetical protein
MSLTTCETPKRDEVYRIKCETQRKKQSRTQVNLMTSIAKIYIGCIILSKWINSYPKNNDLSRNGLSFPDNENYFLSRRGMPFIDNLLENVCPVSSTSMPSPRSMFPMKNTFLCQWLNGDNTSNVGYKLFSLGDNGQDPAIPNQNETNGSVIMNGSQKDFYLILLISITMVWIRILLVHYMTALSCKTTKNKKNNCVQTIVSQGTYRHMLRGSEFGKSPQNEEKEPMFAIGSSIRRSISCSLHLTPQSSPPNMSQKEGSTEDEDLNELHCITRRTTAMFRLLYSIVSSVAAMYFFRSANFWPSSVGGIKNGKTANCWDLAGALFLDKMIDLDFDNSNSNLRYFFIFEASFYLQNLAFCSVSLIARWYLQGTKRSKAKWTNEETNGSPVAVWTLMLHILEDVIRLTVMLVAFLFSSSRRLGAIGIFTLNFSSIFLSLLQVCMNTKTSNKKQSNNWCSIRSTKIFILHRWITVPVFIYCRLYVMPFVVWNSIAFESKGWLIQIERGFNSCAFATTLYLFGNTMMAITFVLQTVYLHRLFFHPYLKKLGEKNAHDSRTVSIINY